MTADGSDRSFGAPRFDVVLRGYDRRQVDEHISRLQRVLGRLRSDLDTARGQVAGPQHGPALPPGARPRPTPRPRPDGLPGGERQDVVGTFTDRMHAILQAAEEEAGEIRGKAKAAAQAEEERVAAARAAVRAEEETLRTSVTELARQRDAVLGDLTRVRRQLEALLSGPTARITVPKPEPDSGPEGRDVAPAQPRLGSTAGPDADGLAPPPRLVPAASRPGTPPRGSAPVGRQATPPAGTQVSAPTTGDLFRPVSGSPRSGGFRPIRQPVEETTVAPAVERTVVVPKAEKPEPDDAPPEADGGDGVEATQTVQAVVRPAAHDTEGGAGTDGGAAGDPEATQVRPASPARSG
jgi:hypothetical protein